MRARNKDSVQMSEKNIAVGNKSSNVKLRLDISLLQFSFINLLKKQRATASDKKLTRNPEKIGEKNSEKILVAQVYSGKKTKEPPFPEIMFKQ